MLAPFLGRKVEGCLAWSGGLREGGQTVHNDEKGKEGGGGKKGKGGGKKGDENGKKGSGNKG